MKTNYLPRSRSKSSWKKLFIIVVTFVIIAFIFSSIDGFLLALAKPIWKGENLAAVKLSNFSELIRSKESLIKENRELKEKLVSLELKDMRSRAAIEREKVMVNSFGRVFKEGKIVSVLVRPPETPYDTLIIDAGSTEGIRRDGKVSVAEGFDIGVISEVFDNTSRVRLYTENKAKTNAVLERGLVPVILEGAGGGNFRLILQRDMAVEVGDKILSPGISPQILGIVGDVRLSPTDAFKEVLVRSPVNIFALTFVSVE